MKRQVDQKLSREDRGERQFCRLGEDDSFPAAIKSAGKIQPAEAIKSPVLPVRRFRRKAVKRWVLRNRATCSIGLTLLAIALFIVCAAIWRPDQHDTSKAAQDRRDRATGLAVVEEEVPDESGGPGNSLEAVEQQATEPPEPPEQLSMNEAKSLVRMGLVASDADQVRQYFHLGDADPSKVLEYLDGLALPPVEQIELGWAGSMAHGERQVTGVVVRWRHKDQIHKRIASLVEDSAGAWKIDYEAFACVCVPSWGEILDGREMGGKVRVVFSKDNYYNGRYQEADWACYRLTSLGSTQAIYGYCRPGSAANMALDMVLGLELDPILIEESSDQPRRRALIEIVRAGENLPNQFEITQVLSMDWVMGLHPFGLPFQSSAERPQP